MLNKEVCKRCFEIWGKDWKRKNERQWEEKGIVVCPPPLVYAKEISEYDKKAQHFLYDEDIPWWWRKAVNNRGPKNDIKKHSPNWCPYETEHVVCQEN